MNNQKTVGFYTLGCKVNSYDTEAMAEVFEKAGYTVVPFEAVADVYVVNTCTVTHLGDRKSRNMLRRARRHNPQATIVAAGCYAQVAPEEVAAITEVDLIIGTNERSRILDAVAAHQAGQAQRNYVQAYKKDTPFEDLPITEAREHTRAFLKVQEGCNQFCTYCIVPYARGRIRSRSLEKVVEEVKSLVAAGFLEVVLTGIHIASYGVDQGNGDSLLTLIEAVAAVPGIKRIRLGSLEPMILTEAFVKAVSAIQSFCPHFHISLQSGSDTVLKRMNRHYTTSDYAAIVARIRRYFSHPAITTDIMVGFPGETQEEFMETLAFVKKIEFYQVHTFKYSRRRGTIAAEMTDQIEESIKNARSHELMALAHALEEAFVKENDGLIKAVLFEQALEEGTTLGHTANYLPVKLKTDKELCGKILNIALRYQSNTGQMIGEIV